MSLPPLSKVTGDEKLDIKKRQKNSGETEDPKVSLGSFLWVSTRPDIKG